MKKTLITLILLATASFSIASESEVINEASALVSEIEKKIWEFNPDSIDIEGSDKIRLIRREEFITIDVNNLVVSSRAKLKKTTTPIIVEGILSLGRIENADGSIFVPLTISALAIPLRNYNEFYCQLREGIVHIALPYRSPFLRSGDFAEIKLKDGAGVISVFPTSVMFKVSSIPDGKNTLIIEFSGFKTTPTNIVIGKSVLDVDDQKETHHLEPNK